MKYRLLKSFILFWGVIIISTLFTQSISATSSDLTGKKICIDPGHGGSDPGAINNEYNLSESIINLDVSYGLKWLLENNGAEVVMTRTDDSYKDNNDRYTFCNSEEATILISIHTNSVVDPTWDGSMALYFHPDDDDRVLAQSIYDVMYPMLKATAPDPDLFLPFGLDWFASGVLLKSNMPAAMMEPLFMSNPEEAELLVQNIYDDPIQNMINDGCSNLNCRRGEIANSIHQGILNYFDFVSSGSMHVSAIEMSYDTKARNYFVYSQITIVDEDNNSVPGAYLTVSLIQPDGDEISITEISGVDGVVTFKFRSNQTGLYETIVTNVSKDGWIYDYSANVESSENLEIP